MASHLERPAALTPSLRRVVADFGPAYAANGFIGFVFSASGPVAVILSVGTGAGLSSAELASWIFGVFFVNGAITHDPKDTGGLDTALKSLLDKPLGSVMVAVIGIGFVAFAVYSAARSKYARV